MQQAQVIDFTLVSNADWVLVNRVDQASPEFCGILMVETGKPREGLAPSCLVTRPGQFSLISIFAIYPQKVGVSFL